MSRHQRYGQSDMYHRMTQEASRRAMAEIERDIIARALNQCTAGPGMRCQCASCRAMRKQLWAVQPEDSQPTGAANAVHHD